MSSFSLFVYLCVCVALEFVHGCVAGVFPRLYVPYCTQVEDVPSLSLF